MSVGHFLGGIAALIWDPATQRYLLLRRAEGKDFQRGAWECVTGRVDQGESYEQALRREVREEIGAQIQVEFLIGTTHFYRGEEQPENELLGVLYGCTLVSTTPLVFNDEHSEYRWVTAEEALAFLPEGHWLHTTITRAETLRGWLPPEMSTDIHEHGFEI